MRLERWRAATRGVLVCAVVLVAGAAEAQAGDDDERAVVEKEAVAFMDDFGAGRHAANYRRVGRRAKELASEEAFAVQCSIVLQRVGGAGSGRRTIDYQRSQRMPGPNGVLYGEFSFVRFAVRYPAGAAYEDVYLEKESDGEWRVVGWWINSAPG